MICPACSAANADDADFCVNCGARLGTACATCGAVDPPGARFCRSCGTPRPGSEPVNPPGERRIVSILFADLVSSTSVAERMDPEAWGELAELALSAMAGAVRRLGGTVTRLMGDGLMALFGAPVTQEDDAERAVRAGLEIVGAAAGVRRQAAASGLDLGEDELEIRVGIATGPVVAGVVGVDEASEYTVLGDTVNLAARLEGLAPPGGVLIADATRLAVAHAIDVHPMGPVEVKGKRQPLLVHRVVGIRPDRSSARGLGVRTRAVGRASETARLEVAVAAAAEGRGGIVMVLGEAGIGKSRLLEDVMVDAAVHHPGLAIFQVSALAFEANIGYSLAGKLLGPMADASMLERHLSTLSPHRQGVVRDVRSALESGASAVPSSMSTESVALAFAEVLTAVSGPAASPVAIVVDDLQWADAASTDLLVSLLAMTDRLPVLFVLAARADRSGPAWAIRQAAESEFSYRLDEIHLAALPPDDARALFASLLAEVALPAAEVDRITQRAEGNPFFLEEIVRELIQVGALVRRGDRWTLGADDAAGHVPGSLQRLLQARFDRLSARTKATLELAAVIGRTFSSELVQRVTRHDPTADLHELLKVGLIVEEDGPGRRYRFGHALAQEAAYESILHRRRRELHRSVGEALEVTEGEQSAAVLVAHFVAAGDGPRARRHAAIAGAQAADLGAYADACRLYDLGIGTLGDDETDEVAVGLFIGRGRSREVTGDLDGSIHDLGTALDMATALDRHEFQWRALIALGEVWAARDYRRTGEFFRRALDVARGRGDPEMVGTSLNRLGNWFVNAADPHRGIELHEEALALFESTASAEGVAASHDLLGTAHMLGGNRDRSRSHYLEALAGFRAMGDRRAVAGTLVSFAIGAPNYEELVDSPSVPAPVAESALREALDAMTALGWSAGEAYARFVLSQVLACTGRLGAGLDQARRSLEIATAIGHDQWRVAALTCLGSAEADSFDFVASRDHLAEALDLAGRIASLNWQLQVSTAFGVTLVRSGDLDEAERVVASAIASPDGAGFAPHRSCLLVQVMIEVEKGNSKAALDTLELVSPSGARPVSPLVALVRGAALHSLGDEAARGELIAGLETAARWGMLPMQWRLHEAIGRLGGPDDGAHLSLAREVLSRCVASLEDPAARRRMVERVTRRHGPELAQEVPAMMEEPIDGRL